MGLLVVRVCVWLMQVCVSVCRCACRWCVLVCLCVSVGVVCVSACAGESERKKERGHVFRSETQHWL